MPAVRFTAFFNGPAAVYTSPTGESDTQVSGAPYLGTGFQVGNYCDLSYADAAVWNTQFPTGTPLSAGRYRVVGVASDAAAANLLPYQPVGLALGPSVQSLGFTAGSGYTNGTYNLSSSVSAGQTAAVAQVVVSGGAIISATLVSGGSGFLTSAVPTFSLTLLGAGSGGAVTAQLAATNYLVTSFTAVAASVTSLIMGISLCNPAPTAAQITAGCFIIIQELGVAPVKVTTATSTTSGAQVVAVSGGTVTTQTAAYSGLEIGYARIAPVAGQVIPVQLTLQDLPI